MTKLYDNKKSEHPKIGTKKTFLDKAQTILQKEKDKMGLAEKKAKQEQPVLSSEDNMSEAEPDVNQLVRM